MMALDDRIANAFREDAPPAEIATLIEEAEVASAAAIEASGRARERALDPALSPSEADQARGDMEVTAFRRDRLAEAARRLREQLEVARRREENARRKAIYDEAKAERDAVATELAQRWPELEAELVRLLERLEASDTTLRRANAELPSGWSPLAPADLVARETKAVVGGQEVRRLLKAKLPAFRFDSAAPYAWPRPQRVA
jgi:hypothetical protein